MPDCEQFTLRHLAPDEIPLVAPCLRRLADFHNSLETSFKGLYPTMPTEVHLAHMRDHVANDTARIVGLFLPDGSLRGFGMASYEGDYGEVDYLFVNEELREQGCGGMILDQLLAYLDEKAIRLIDINVVDGNPARDFYEKYGFVPRSVVLSRRMR